MSCQPQAVYTAPVRTKLRTTRLSEVMRERLFSTIISRVGGGFEKCCGHWCVTADNITDKFWN